MISNRCRWRRRLRVGGVRRGLTRIVVLCCSSSHRGLTRITRAVLVPDAAEALLLIPEDRLELGLQAGMDLLPRTLDLGVGLVQQGLCRLSLSL